MLDLLESARLSDQLLEIRDTQRYLANHATEPGDQSAWFARVRPYIDVLRGLHAETGDPYLTCASKAARRAEAEGRPYIALMFLAAGVELVDPTPTEVPNVA